MTFGAESGERPCQSDPKLSCTRNVGDAPGGLELFPGEKDFYQGAAGGSGPGAAGGCAGTFVND